MALIAVDMTPALPGGKNGGAKILAIELLKSFQKLAQQDEFLVLTASWNHEELAFLDGPNMTRSLILRGPEPEPESAHARYSPRLQRAIGIIRRQFRRFVRGRIPMAGSLSSRGVALLFCPFTAPFFSEAHIPTVSVVLDLQHREMPHFFTRHEVGLRNDFMAELKHKADQIICISEYTRKAAIKHLDILPEKIHAVPISIQARISRPKPEEMGRYLREFGIAERPYMFYPANFWPHKNHKMLLTAYGMFLAHNPENPLDLVLTGALNGDEEAIKRSANQMGLKNRVHFLGFVPEQRLAAVWFGCEFLVFPSLYEGFGIPILEAMAIGKPVLSSDRTSLPEVAGEAALYFDPRKPEALVKCIEEITQNASLRDALVSKGFNRAALFKTEDMTRRYLKIFQEAIRKPDVVSDEITGIFKDGWMGEKTVVRFASGPPDRILEMKLEAPSWLPARRIKVTLEEADETLQRAGLRSGRTVVIRQPLPERQGHITFSLTPTFNPSDFGMGDDLRNLSVICRDCKMLLPGEEKSLLK